MKHPAEINQYERVRQAVEQYGQVKNESQLRDKLLADGYDPALIARALSDRKWRRGTSTRQRFATGAIMLGYALYGVCGIAAFAFALTRPGGAQPPRDGLILGAIVLIIAAVLAVLRRPGVGAGFVAGFVVMALVSGGAATLFSDRYETLERTVLMYPLIGAIAALFLMLMRRVP